MKEMLNQVVVRLRALERSALPEKCVNGKSTEKLSLNWPVQFQDQATVANYISHGEVPGAKIWLAMMLWDSDNKEIQAADISIQTGPKWKVRGALREEEECLQHAAIKL